MESSFFFCLPVSAAHFLTAMCNNFFIYFFIKFKNQGQICNLLVMGIPKLSSLKLMKN